MWIGLNQSLTILSLRDNYISSLDERSFASCSKIRELDLGQNRIEHIDPQAFAALPELRILYLDDNKLGYHSPPSFPAFLQPLSQLAELNMAKNEFHWLADELFSSLPELSQLDVSGCKLRNVSSLAFSGLNRLRVLKLHDNLLSAVPTSAWALLGQLETLTIGQNNMTTLGAEAFAGLERLKQLDMSNIAQLISVHPEALNTNRDLIQLRMSNCKQLTTLPEQLLARTVNLRKLYLRDNGLVTLPEKFLLGVQLLELDLSDNAFHCDCQLAWLRDYILRGGSNNNILTTQARPKRSSSNGESAMELFGQLSQLDLLSCVSPPPVAKMNLQSLSDDQLGCRMSLLSSPQSIVVGVSVAGAAIVLCFVFLLCRYRRRIGQLLCCRGPNTKPHPTKSLDDSRLSTKWRPASPTTWAAGVGPSVSLIGHHAASTSSNRFSNGSEYHKACTNEEECFMRAVTLHNSLKPFPRTELWTFYSLGKSTIPLFLFHRVSYPESCSSLNKHTINKKNEKKTSIVYTIIYKHWILFSWNPPFPFSSSSHSWCAMQLGIMPGNIWLPNPLACQHSTGVRISAHLPEIFLFLLFLLGYFLLNFSLKTCYYL